MFTITGEDIRAVLHDYGIQDECLSFSELERYHYAQEDPESRQVRVIVKVNLQGGRSLVVCFKNEEDAPQHVIETQSRFAVLLYEHGVETPKVYASDGLYARCCTINGYDVIVTVESFEEGEIRAVDPETARETGKLLARIRGIRCRRIVHP